MLERREVRDERGRVTGYVVTETTPRAIHFRSGARPPEPESLIAVSFCLVFGVVMLVASLLYLWSQVG